MPRRNGTLTPEQQAAAQASLAPPPGPTPEQQAALQAAGALAAARAAAATAHAAPAVIAAPAAAAAVGAGVAAILAAFDRMLVVHRTGQEQQVTDLVAQEIPDLPDLDRLQIVKSELDAEKAYAAKARARLQRDLPTVLAIADPEERRQAIARVLDRERRYADQRDHAVAIRALGQAEKRLVKSQSPEGAYWRLSPLVRQHTPDCLAMGGKVWPWSVLDNYAPPLHTGCGCQLLPVQQAVDEGLASAGSFQSHDQAIIPMQVTEAAWDPELLDVDGGLSEAPHGMRWWRGTTGPGRYRPRQGDLAAALRLRRAPRQAAIPVGQGNAKIEPVTHLDGDRLHVSEIPTGDLAVDDQVLLDGELRVVEQVRAPGVVRLSGVGTVLIDIATVRGVPAMVSQAVSEAPWDPLEHPRDRGGKWRDGQHAAEREAQASQPGAPREFTDLDQARAWATAHFAAWRDSLSPEEHHSLHVYKADSQTRYLQMNDALRGDAQWTDVARRHAPVVEHALRAKVGPILVHRTAPIEHVGEWPPADGSQLEHRAFTSTSLLASIPPAHYTRTDQPVHMHLTLPHGTRAGFLDTIGDPTHDAEILLPAGAVMRVDSTHVDEHGARHLHATVVGFRRPASLQRGPA